MQLVEKHIINANHKFFKELDFLAFQSKNLYNSANYLIRQKYIKENEFINYNSIDELLQSTLDYKKLPSKVSQQVLKLLDTNWKSYFKANSDFKRNPTKYLGNPKLPKYKDKLKGRNILIYTIQAISKKYLKKRILKLSKTNIELPIQISDLNSIQQVRIVPKYNFYVIEIVYNFKEKELKVDNLKYASIDLGVKNLATVSTNIKDLKPFIINGKPLKSINQFYNKQKSYFQSLLEKVNKTKNSKRLVKLSFKRENKIKNYLYKASNYIISYLLMNNINTLIIGKNKNWKQKVDLKNKINNQNFVSIPYNQFISMLEYKCKLQGINFILIQESYTSICSFLDLEEIKKHEVYKGFRLKRGLFKASNGKIVNADLNASLNILRLAFPNAILNDVSTSDKIEDFVVNPKIISLK